ncbi:MAG: hypothetical protein V3U69_04155, partial [Bacteroidota bacterium]
MNYESATHSEYTYEPTINISATLATSAQDSIRLEYFYRIGANLAEFNLACHLVGNNIVFPCCLCHNLEEVKEISCKASRPRRKRFFWYARSSSAR